MDEKLDNLSELFNQQINVSNPPRFGSVYDVWSGKYRTKCNYEYCNYGHRRCAHCNLYLTCLEYNDLCENFNDGYGVRDNLVICDKCMKVSQQNNVCLSCRMELYLCVCMYSICSIGWLED